MLPRLLATRYVSPLREGGSLPGIVEADDLGTYVMKFQGAGQGRKALVAEVIVTELARRLELSVPDLAAVELDEAIARFEADQEVQDLLTASLGLNLGIDYLPGSYAYDPIRHHPDPAQAATILWLDGLTANVDRSWRNPNMLWWHTTLYCIDHGAALWFHHAWERSSPDRFAAQPFDAADHIFGTSPAALAELARQDEALAARVTPRLIAEVLAEVPDEWLDPAPGFADPDEVRDLYAAYLEARLAQPRRWLPGRPTEHQAEVAS